MREIHAATWAFAGLLALCGAQPSPAEEGWISNSYSGPLTDSHLTELARWINDVCRPGEMGHIVGFSYQTGPKAPLNLHVFCLRGGDGKLGKVKILRHAFAGDYDFKTKHLGGQQTASIIGFELAAAPSDAQAGTVLIVVKD